MNPKLIPMTTTDSTTDSTTTLNRLNPMNPTPGPYPLTITKVGDFFVIATNQGNHFAKTVDPCAARLIASAPEMLAALELIYSNAAESPEWIRARIVPAIAKAIGESESLARKIMKRKPSSHWMIESPTADNPTKNKYTIAVDSKTIEVYSESIAEALSLSGIPADSIKQFEEWLIGSGKCGSISENDQRLNQ